MKKVAIVADWLIGGGAELVVQELHKMYPEAPIFTSYCSDEWRARLNNKVVTGYLQKWPFSKLRKFTPFLRQRWFEKLDLSEFDLVISESGAEAKGVITSGKTTHVNYCNSPTHYYWSRYDEYMKNPGFGRLNLLARFGLRLLVKPMRSWDFKAAQKPDYIIADSSHIKKMIKKYYNRDSEVIFPPVETQRFSKKTQTKEIRNGFIVTGRQVPYKRFDLPVIACTKLGLSLKVLGGGPEHNRLKKLAGPTIEFIKYPSNKELAKHVRTAEAYIFPGMDDFGISPVEAIAAGTPVIAYKAGGALDYVKPGVSGVFFNEQSVDSLVRCLNNFDPGQFNSGIIKRVGSDFDQKTFQRRIKTFIKNI